MIIIRSATGIIPLQELARFSQSLLERADGSSFILLSAIGENLATYNLLH